MAWQLIYTSADRLLDAGKTGLGTIARHSSIHPVIVSGVEKMSQFSRHGYPATRVILSHRIIAIGSSKFHVLSQVRNVSKEYSLRENHIAHHLIVPATELSQMRGSIPSPADILIQMQWRSHWSAAPAWLETNDEINLSQFSPTTDPSCPNWAQATGRPNCQWLLATGKFSKGSCIIVPQGISLIHLFAESLQLPTQRPGAWQSEFTTSLQATEEPAGFRWVGVENDSPKKLDLEASGRPILNLSRPESLPTPEVPVISLPTPTVTQSPRRPTEVPLPFIAPPTAAAAGTFSPSPPSIGYSDGRKQVALNHSSARQSKLPLVALVASMLILLVAAGLVWKSKTDAAELREWKQTALNLQLKETTVEKLVELRKSNEEAAEELLKVAQDQFQSLNSPSESPRSHTLTNWRKQFLGVNAPPEIGLLEDQLTEWTSLSKSISAAKLNPTAITRAIKKFYDLNPDSIRDEFTQKFEQSLQNTFSRKPFGADEISLRIEDIISMQDAALKLTKNSTQVQSLFKEFIEAELKPKEAPVTKEPTPAKEASTVTVPPPAPEPEKNSQVTQKPIPDSVTMKQLPMETKVPRDKSKTVFLASTAQLKEISNIKLDAIKEIKLTSKDISKKLIPVGDGFQENFNSSTTNSTALGNNDVKLYLPETLSTPELIEVFNKDGHCTHQIYISQNGQFIFTPAQSMQGVILIESPPQLKLNDTAKSLATSFATDNPSAKLVLKATKQNTPVQFALAQNLDAIELPQPHPQIKKLEEQLRDLETTWKQTEQREKDFIDKIPPKVAQRDEKIKKARESLEEKRRETDQKKAALSKLIEEAKAPPLAITKQFTGTFDLYLKIDPNLEVLVQKLNLTNQ